MGLPGPAGSALILAQLSTTADWENRASWTVRDGEPTLAFASDSWRASLSAALRVHERVGAEACGPSRVGGAPFVPEISLTAHPLGGVPFGRATDLDGRVIGCPNMYVVDGALIPGNCAAANPSLTIAGLELAADAGIQQFIDLGSGIPNSPNVHEAAREVEPTAQVVYVD